MKKIFQHSQLDAFLILYTVLMLVLPYMLSSVYTTFSLIWLIIILAHAFLLANYRNSALHHQGHWPMFVNKQLNQFYEMLASATAFTSNQSWKCNHFLHHKYVNDYPVDGKTKDPASVYKDSRTQEATNFWVYTLKNGYNDLYTAVFTIPLSPPLKKIKKLQDQGKREVYFFKFYLATIFLVNWKYAFLFLITLYLCCVFDRAISYGEHWGALDQRGDTTKDSIGIYSKWYNIIGFGAGLHQEHHRSPGTHWTKYHTITGQLSPDRKIVNGMHITNNPFWSHFKLLFKK